MYVHGLSLGTMLKDACCHERETIFMILASQSQ